MAFFLEEKQLAISIPNKHAGTTWLSVNVDRNGLIKTILKVETTLNLNPMHPAHNTSEFASLQADIVEYMKANPHIDSADILQI